MGWAMNLYKTMRSILAAIILAGPTFVRANTYASVDLLKAFTQVDHIRLVRIVSAEFDGAAPLECRYRYRTEVLVNLKGDAPLVFYLSESAVIGSRYLLMGNIGKTCGDGGASMTLPLASALHPVLPYGFDEPDERSWIAFGGTAYTFPSGIRQADGPTCYAPTENGSVNPCLVPLPAVNLHDVIQLLRQQLVRQRSRHPE